LISEFGSTISPASGGGFGVPNSAEQLTVDSSEVFLAFLFIWFPQSPGVLSQGYQDLSSNLESWALMSSTSLVRFLISSFLTSESSF